MLKVGGQVVTHPWPVWFRAQPIERGRVHSLAPNRTAVLDLMLLLSFCLQSQEHQSATIICRQAPNKRAAMASLAWYACIGSGILGGAFHAKPGRSTVAFTEGHDR